MDERLVTVPALARRLGLHPTTIRRWIRRGSVPAPQMHRITGQRFFDEETALGIEARYFERVRERGTRGPGAARTRARGHAHTTKSGRSTLRGATATPAEVVTRAAARWLELGDDYSLPPSWSLP